MSYAYNAERGKNGTGAAAEKSSSRGNSSDNDRYGKTVRRNGIYYGRASQRGYRKRRKADNIMKLVYKNMGHILSFYEGYVNELIVENRKMFFDLVNSMTMQIDGSHGDCVLSVANKPVEFHKYADIMVQFAPFQLNRKSLLTKLYAMLEKRSSISENYMKTEELLGGLEKYIFQLSEELPFEIDCKKLAIGPIIRAIAPEIEEGDKSVLEKIFAYMELVRELDRDKLFIMVNMRSYFSDEEMERFTESASFHDFKVLLLENSESPKLKYTKRYVIDEDLCEF